MAQNGPERTSGAAKCLFPVMDTAQPLHAPRTHPRAISGPAASTEPPAISPAIFQSWKILKNQGAANARPVEARSVRPGTATHITGQ